MQVSQSFEDNVKKWVLLDNKIKTAQDAIRVLKKEKELAGNDMLIYIKTYELEEKPIGITGGKLKYAVSKTTISMSKNYIENRLETYFKSKTKAKEVIDYIYSNRETKEKDVIRRTKNRQNN